MMSEVMVGPVGSMASLDAQANCKQHVIRIVIIIPGLELFIRQNPHEHGKILELTAI